MDERPFLIEQAAAYYHPLVQPRFPGEKRELLVQLVFDTLFVNGPERGQTASVVVNKLPEGTWTQVRDRQGQPLPVAVVRDGGALRGAWLPVG